ncbi:MAG: hypothetical protein ACI4Q3_05645 [Kiritimatiellia bacterium]
MKLRKSENEPAPAATATQTGGAVIADRFKLDIDMNASKGSSGVGTAASMVALICSLASIAMLGTVAALMYMNWELIENV